jgi:hypothetical protein
MVPTVAGVGFGIDPASSSSSISSSSSGGGRCFRGGWRAGSSRMKRSHSLVEPPTLELPGPHTIPVAGLVPAVGSLLEAVVAHHLSAGGTAASPAPSPPLPSKEPSSPRAGKRKHRVLGEGSSLGPGEGCTHDTTLYVTRLRHDLTLTLNSHPKPAPGDENDRENGQNVHSPPPEGTL